ncbi:MAG TPA: glycosyltransferase family 39 protein [Dehalococcoidia bacterium]|nr:glycosyltransferase family 39 protein [Dehalococcoidia bacterium]
MTAAALLMRLWGLSGLPHGLHGDEAATGLDARKILAGTDLFPYTPSALGQPSGPMYWAALWIKLLGSTIFAVRLAMALLGVGTVVLGYYAFRLLFGRPVAWAGATMLAFSSWLVFYNRTGFTASAMPFTEMAALLAVAVALRKGSPAWFILAGAVVGAGIYGYFSFPLFAVALAVWLVLHALVERLRPFGLTEPFWLHARNGALMALTALLLIQPMWPYFTGKNQGYTHDRQVFALSKTQAYQQADTLGRVRLYWDNARHVINVLREGGHPDASDGSGEVSALDPLLVVLSLAGAALCAVLAVTRKRAAYLLPLIVVPIVLIGPIWSAGGVHRRSLGILPFVIMPAAVLLGTAWEWLRDHGRPGLAAAALCVPLALFAATNIDRYFRQTPDSQVMLFTYAPELTDAALLIDAQPRDVHVYFASGRWSAGYETVQYLVPNRALGDGTLEDRSKEFSKITGYGGLDRTHPALIVLMNNYMQDADKVAAEYPEAKKLVGATVNRLPAFIAFSIPARQATGAP